MHFGVFVPIGLILMLIFWNVLIVALATLVWFLLPYAIVVFIIAISVHIFKATG